MKIELLAENIQPHLATLSKNIATSTQLPILSNILLKATPESFMLQATDLELGVEVRVPAKITEEGTTTVPGREFIEAISALPQDKITLSQKGNVIEISVRKTKVKLETIPPDDFPTLFEEKGDLLGTYTAKDIENTFAKIIFSTAPDDTRPELTGILIKQLEERAEYVSTDGFRLSRVSVSGQKIGEVGEWVIIPKRLLTELIAQKKDGELFLNKKGHQIVFESDAATMVSRMLHGNFPNYERVIPKSSSITASLAKDDLLSDLRLSTVFSKKNSNMVTCEFKENTLKVSSKAASLGEQESELEAKKEGEDITLTFNSNYLRDALRSIEGTQVTLEMSGGHDPVVFKDEKAPNFLHVVMPVRT